MTQLGRYLDYGTDLLVGVVIWFSCRFRMCLLPTKIAEGAGVM